MTAAVWGKPVRERRQCTRRDEIFERVCCYTDEMDGPTPSINEVALHFRLNYKTVYYRTVRTDGASFRTGADPLSQCSRRHHLGLLPLASVVPIFPAD